MKFRHLFWAIILISIGIFALLGNFGVLHFSWFSFWRLWPLILIFIGISLLPVRDVIKYTLLIVTIVTAIIFYNRIPNTHPFWLNFHNGFSDDNSKEWNWDDKDSGDSSNSKEQSLSVPFDSLALKGILNLDAAAGNFSLGDSTKDFLSFRKSGDIGNYELTTGDGNGIKTIHLKMKEGTIRHNINKNTVDIQLNTKPVWSLKFEIGAAKIDLDLSRYRVDTAKFEAGASSMEIKVGDKNPVTNLSFDAGASSITVKVPKTSGCQVTTDSFMVSKEFEELNKISDNKYQSAGFSSSKNKVYITVQSAVSKIRVERY